MGKSKNKKMISVYLPPELIDKMYKELGETKKPLSHIAQEALEERYKQDTKIFVPVNLPGHAHEETLEVAREVLHSNNIKKK